MATRFKELGNLPPNVRDLLSSVIWGYLAGTPTDGVTGAGEAGPGCLLFDTTNKVVYHNTGTLASPVWNSLGGVAASEITLADGKVLIGGASGVAAAQTLSGDATVTNAGVVALAAQIINGADIANVADANVIGGVPVVHRIAIADSAGDTTVVLTHKTRIVDVIAVKKASAGGAGDTVTVKNVATAVTNAIDLNVADKTVVRAGTIDDAQWEVAAGANLVVTAAKNTNCAAEVYVIGLRIA